MGGDLGGAVVWEAENAGGNAAESDAFEIIFGSEGEAAFVAAGELGFVLRRQRSVDDGADGVENIARWQIVARCDLGLAGRFEMALRFHDAVTFEAQLHAGEGVDGVVDAVVVRLIAAGHAAVGGVDDGVDAQRGDIALPEINPWRDRREIVDIGDALCGKLAAQIFVLHLEHIVSDGRWRTHVHERAQKSVLLVALGGDGNFLQLLVFGEQRFDEKSAAIGLSHGSSSFVIDFFHYTPAQTTVPTI